MREVGDSTSSSTQPLEDKLSALEAKFAALEKKYSELQDKAATVEGSETERKTEASTGSDAQTSKDTGVDAATTTQDETEPSSRAKILLNRVDPKTGERKDHLPTDEAPIKDQKEKELYAFTLRKKIYDKSDDADAEIEIMNEALWELLKELLSHYPYHLFQGPPITLNSPYEPLILYWDKLEEAAKKTPINDRDGRARSDLKLLLETIKSSSGDPKLDKYLKNKDANKEQNTVTFETLWTIFPPGTLVYGKPFQGQDQLFLVQDNARTWPTIRRGSALEQPSWALVCWSYDWDGKTFRRAALNLEFEYFEGQKPITALQYYPFELHRDKIAVKKDLIDRGQLYRRLCTSSPGSRMFYYDGDAIFVKQGFSSAQNDEEKEQEELGRTPLGAHLKFLARVLGTPNQEAKGPPVKSSHVDSRVMVDFESYFLYGPPVAHNGSLKPNTQTAECVCIDCRENNELMAMYRTRFDDAKTQKGRWEDEQYMLCPPRVLGYVLRDKQWAQLQATLVQPIPLRDPDDTWSKRLKLADGEKTKNMILELVTGHGTSADGEHDDLQVDDIIARKGKGLVILLYGPPGVGKTSTAETVAVAARKPLFSISVADVGTRATNVEANLAKIFALATSWQAILLIDEADVFLESRGKGIASNTERNALVSVFLRVLEYYQGILMLTTNQIAQFDVAVHSRIHVAIKYTDLNKSQKRAIFMGFLEPLNDRGVVRDMKDITDWLEEDVVEIALDGRQIRNIVTSALGLARAQKKEKLEKGHLKQVLSNVKDFKGEFIRQMEKYRTEQQQG